MEIWSPMIDYGNPSLCGFVALGIPSAPYFVVKLFICLRNSDKCTHICPDICGLLIWGIIPRHNQIILYISDWYMALWKSLKHICAWSSRWRATYRVGSINFDVALISCLRGKSTEWLALIPKTHKTITNVIQSVFTQLLSFGLPDRHGEHTISLFWIIVFKAT